MGQFDLLGHFLLFDWAWSKLSKATVNIFGSLNSQEMIFFMITTGPLNSEDMIRILKQSGYDFSGKICVMDIVWMLHHVYVWRVKFN